jgi:ubiquinone/menaquinone biosynthesis C-methylase UbiE
LTVDGWYEQSFGRDYLTVYKHRDLQGAAREVRRMMDWLHLPAGAEVLDLCCGMGRHSLALTELGLKVTGVDLSEVLLEEARKLDAQAQVTWVRGDMRQVPLNRIFDAVVNLFTSFGYFENDDENAQVLREIDRLLAPGGRFIIDYMNPSYVIRNLVPASERMEGNERIEERRSIEQGFVRKRIVIEGADTPQRSYLEQVKLYSLDQMKRMAATASLRVDQVYGGYDGSVYDEQTSERMILVGGKPE